MADRYVDDQMRPGDIDRILDDLSPASEARGTPGHDLADGMARRTKAVTLKLAGMTYEQVAAEAGYSEASAARNAVLRALEKVHDERVTELRAVENARLDRAQAAIWPKVIAGDIKAVDTWLRLSARRARMNGLDAPTQVAVMPSDLVGLDAAMDRLHDVVMGTVIAAQDDTPEDGEQGEHGGPS